MNLFHFTQMLVRSILLNVGDWRAKSANVGLHWSELQAGGTEHVGIKRSNFACRYHYRIKLLAE